MDGTTTITCMSSGRTFLASLARTALVMASVCMLGVAGFIVLSGRYLEMSRAGGTATLGLLVGSAVAIGFAAVRLSRSGILRLAREMSALAACLVLADIVICLVAPAAGSTYLERKWAAERLGIPFDARTKSEVVTALRARGIDALPGVTRDWPRSVPVRQQLPEGLFPLSDASNADIVECNEGGRYLVFRSDELGFNNPAGLVLGGRFDVAAVGASFTLGHCIADGNSFINLLRRSYPKIANLGLAGSASLSMLATFREYVEPAKPPLVLWIMQANTVDVRDELADPVLSRYLDPTFSQHLLRRRQEVDQAWRAISLQVQYELDHHAVLAAQTAARNRFAGILTLSQLRGQLHVSELLAQPPPSVDFGPFLECVKLARQATESWGGHFVVVIMPLYAEVVAHDLPEPLQHDHLASLLRTSGFKVIDTVPAFLSRTDPRSLYVMRRNNHPTEEGHRLLAEFIAARLREAERAPPLVVREGKRR